MLLTRGEKARFEAADLCTEEIPFFSFVAACGLHAIDLADEFWEIEILNGLVESLDAHEKSPLRYIRSVKHAGILDFGNGYLPHRLGASRARSLPTRAALDFVWPVSAKKSTAIGFAARDSLLNVSLNGVIMS
jgi:hypothetical protein